MVFVAAGVWMAVAVRFSFELFIIHFCPGLRRFGLLNLQIMKELLLGLLGGGAVVQLFNAVATLRQSRRQMDASALGTEVQALERTIAVISDNLERQNAAHQAEVETLRAEIESLRRCKLSLEREVTRLADEVRRLGGDVADMAKPQDATLGRLPRLAVSDS